MKARLTLVFVLSISALFGQNLVMNHSFETYSFCPTGGAQIGFADFWESPAASTSFISSELIHMCSGTGEDVFDIMTCPINTFGQQEPFDGEGYAGIWAFFPLTGGSMTVNECVQGEFSEPLEAGVEYEFSMRVSLGDNSQYAIDNLGAFFSSADISLGTTIPYTLDIIPPDGEFITDKEGWTQISGTYTAYGGEQYITIGNFESYYTTDFISTDYGIYAGAYYYIDMVELYGPEPEPQPAILGDTLTCAGDSIVLTAINSSDWAWSTVFDMDTVLSSDSILVDAPTQSIVYILEHSEGTITHAVEVIPLPEIELGENQLLCEGETAELEINTNAQSFYWEGGVTDSLLSIAEEGDYIAYALDSLCFNSDTVSVSFEMPFDLNLGEDILICEGEMLVLSADMLPDDYEPFWNGDVQSETYEATESGEVILFADNGVCQTEDAVYIEFEDCLYQIELPNIFTPDKDAFNAFFRPIILERVDILETKIFNRWGNEIFSTDDPLIMWDGKNQNGEAVPEGTYYYLVNCQFPDDEQITIQGTVMLIKNK